jgi:protein required for attachment to host cells
MHVMIIPAGTHVFVADGRQFLLFENTGLAAHPKLRVAAHRERASVATRDQGADRPGKTHASIGGARSAFEQTDFHRQDEDELAAEGADLLRRRVLAGEVKALIVVAAPRILGQLRKRYHGEVRSRILAEIPKEVAGRRADEIASIIIDN